MQTTKITTRRLNEFDLMGKLLVYQASCYWLLESLPPRGHQCDARVIASLSRHFLVLHFATIHHRVVFTTACKRVFSPDGCLCSDELTH